MDTTCLMQSKTSVSKCLWYDIDSFQEKRIKGLCQLSDCRDCKEGNKGQCRLDHVIFAMQCNKCYKFFIGFTQLQLKACLANNCWRQWRKPNDNKSVSFLFFHIFYYQASYSYEIWQLSREDIHNNDAKSLKLMVVMFRSQSFLKRLQAKHISKKLRICRMHTVTEYIHNMHYYHMPVLIRCGVFSLLIIYISKNRTQKQRNIHYSL